MTAGPGKGSEADRQKAGYRRAQGKSDSSQLLPSMFPGSVSLAEFTQKPVAMEPRGQPPLGEEQSESNGAGPTRMTGTHRVGENLLGSISSERNLE